MAGKYSLSMMSIEELIEKIIEYFSVRTFNAWETMGSACIMIDLSVTINIKCCEVLTVS